MTDQPVERPPIAPPRTKHPDDRARVPLEAAISLVPGGSAITKLVGEFVPTQAQKYRGKWEVAVSERTNENTSRIDDHDQVLNPTTILKGVAVDLAVALARALGDGMSGPGRRLADLCALLPDADRTDVEQAAFDLNSLSLVTITRALGRDNWWLRLTQTFYEQIDHQVMSWQSSTEKDARSLAKLLLEDEAREQTSSLHDAIGWELRRFNPAFKALLRCIPEGRVSQEVQPDYPARSLSLIPEDRAALRRFATGSLAPQNHRK